MKICLYGTEQDGREIMAQLGSLPEYAYRKIELDVYTDYDGYTDGLRSKRYDTVLVTENGAEGMEGVIAAGNVDKNTPVIWFSDDGGFGAQSYRLGTVYFHEKPISPEVLSTALGKCAGQIRKANTDAV